MTFIYIAHVTAVPCLSLERAWESTHIVSNVAHQSRGEIQEHDLKIHDVSLSRGIVQRFLGVGKDGRQNIFNENFHVGIIEEAKSSLSLDLPQFPISVDDAIP